MNPFEGLLQDNSFPFYVLFIEIDPKHIDVNVHPTKTEIKFDDERAVYAVVRSAVRQALGAHNLTPAIDFQADVNLIDKLNSPQALTSQQYYEEQFGNSLQRSNLERWEKLFEEEESTSRLFHQSEPDQKVTLRFESAINREADPALDQKIAFQLHEKYIVRSVKNGLMIIDQQGAHERVLFEKFIRQLQGHPRLDPARMTRSDGDSVGQAGGSQQSLFPQTVNFSPSDFALVMEMEEEIKVLGFRFEAFGKNTLLISGIPAGTAGGEKELFEGLIEQFKKNQAGLALPLHENLARSLAKRAGIKSGQKLGREEIEALVSGLFACHTPNFTPEGDTTFFIFDTSKIESYFRR